MAYNVREMLNSFVGGLENLSKLPHAGLSETS